MRRTVIAMTVLAMAVVPAATASADDSSTLHDYSVVRDQLKQCNLDTNWNQLSESSRADCDDLFAKYVLFADSSQEETYYIHCRSSSNCIPTPDGFPAADGPIPAGSTVYDTKPRSTSTRSTAASRRHHKHHTRHHR
jgi:hypothetical protein